ncbi:MAG: hypothetical protein KIH63_001025 [Candidatus Saccharibacteria bacterium]|nr:hypothetical protein [Candidatus Saccharibacteria bacterium]
MNRLQGYGFAAGAGVIVTYGCLMLTGWARTTDARENPDLVATDQLSLVAACEREPSILEKTVHEDGAIDLKCGEIVMAHTSDYLPDFDATRADIEEEREEGKVIFYPNETADYIMMALAFVVSAGAVVGATEACRYYD